MHNPNHEHTQTRSNKIKLLKKEMVAEGTEAFYFEKPENFTFIAGQHGDFTLINPPETDAEGNTRSFSFITAPHEQHIGIATRMRDTAFKRVLGEMEPRAIGSQITLKGPMGDFMLHENAKRPAIFLAGGIGITPFMSIIKDAIHRNLPHMMYLFYSNRRPQDASFLSDLVALDKQSAQLLLVATMTDATKESWQGKVGYIDMAKVDEYVPDRTNAVYYTAGPEKMVKAMRDMLNAAGVSNDDIKTEEFAGY